MTDRPIPRILRRAASPIPITHAGPRARVAPGPVAVDVAALPALLVQAVGRAFETLWLWQTRAEERVHLLALDDHVLQDIGVTRADAEAEARKPFWRP